MSDAERAAGMVGCWYGDQGPEIGDLFHVEGHDGAGRVKVRCLWLDGSENMVSLRASLLAKACRRVA